MNVIDLENEIITVSTETINKLFRYDNGADLVALYMFYHKQCKIQKTNQSFTVSDFAKKWLRRWDTKFKKAKKKLKELWLIEDIKHRNEKWEIKWWFIKLNYIKQANLSTGAETHPVGKSTGGWQETNAWSSLNINAWEKKSKEFEFQSKRELKEFITEIYNKDNSLFDVAHLRYIWPWIEKLREKGYKVNKMEWNIIGWYKYFKETTIKYCWITNTWPAYWEMELVLERMFNWLDEKEKKSWNIKNTILTFLTKSKWK